MFWGYLGKLTSLWLIRRDGELGVGFDRTRSVFYGYDKELICTVAQEHICKV